MSFRNLFVGALFSSAALGADQQVGFSYSQRGSEFDLRIVQTFSADIAWAKVLKIHGDPLLIGKVSEYFVSSILESPIVPSQPFALSLVAEEYGFRKTTVNNCRELSDNGGWQRECEIDLTRGDGGTYFRWGYPATHCFLQNGIATCEIRFHASPKGFNYFIVRRSDREMAARLAAVTLNDTVKLGQLVLGIGTPETVKKSFKQHPSYKIHQSFRSLVESQSGDNFDISGDTSGNLDLQVR